MSACEVVQVDTVPAAHSLVEPSSKEGGEKERERERKREGRGRKREGEGEEREKGGGGRR